MPTHLFHITRHPIHERVRVHRATSRIAATAVSLAIALLLLISASSSAAEVRSGASPDVPDGATVDDDLYLFGGSAAIDGTVARDAVVSAGTLHVPGRVTGNLVAAVGQAEIPGTVGRTVRITGGTLNLSGDVLGDLLVLGGTVTVAQGATVGGDILVTGGNVTILGDTGGDVRGNVGVFTLDGSVGGEVRVTADRVRIRPDARIDGALHYQSQREAEIDPGAAITGEIVRHEPSRFFPGGHLATWLGGPLLRVLWGLIAGVLVVLLLPHAAVTVANAARRLLPTFLVGLVLLLLLPVALALLAATIIGIPIAVIGLAFTFVALYLSQVFVGLAIGRLILPSSWDDGGRGYNLLAVALGIIILAAVRLIPVPYLNITIATITAILGLGAVVVGLHRAQRAPAALPSR